MGGLTSPKPCEDKELRTLLLLLVLLILPIFSQAAEPQDNSPPPTRAELQSRLNQLEMQMRELVRSSNKVESIAVGDTEPSVCVDCGKPIEAFEDYDPEAGYPTWRVGGFFQLDAGFYNQDSVNRATLGDIEDGLGFRRTRLVAKGNVTDRTSFNIEFDFSQAQPRFVDVWMQFADTPAGNVRVGRYRQPFGMAELTSAKELPFLERSLRFTLTPFRQTGIMLFDTAFNNRMTWFASGYRYLSDNFGNVYADTDGYGFATRVVFRPLDDGANHLVHVGFDYSHNEPGRRRVQYVNSNEFFIGQNPNLGPPSLPVLPLVSVPPFVNTGAMPTNRTDLFNLEGAVSLGRFAIQSEATWARVELLDGTINTFPGAYAQLRYVLTGETIPYLRKSGVLGRVKPFTPVDVANGEWGAWELTARVSYLDLNGAGLPGPGRRLTDTTVGLNWYLNSHTKFQLNWIHADLADPTLGDSNADTLAIRGQIDF